MNHSDSPVRIPHLAATERRVRLFVCLLLTLHGGLLAWIGWRCSPTLDEMAHLPAGISHWEFGRFELYRVNPPLVRMLAGLPVLWTGAEKDWGDYTDAPFARPEFGVGRKFCELNGLATFWYFTLARWACIPLSLIGGFVCYRWARTLYGTPAGLWALSLWCFSPNILGNASMITPDAGAAALGVAAGYLFWRWLKEPHWSSALFAGLGLGAAELTKSTWIVLFALWPTAWLFWRWTARRPATSDSASPEPSLAASKQPPARHLATILLVGIYILNLGYGFEQTFVPLGKYEFISQTLGGPKRPISTGNRFTGGWLERIPVPVPMNYLRGLDVQRYDFEIGKWSYLRGQQQAGGWWYWYLYALAVKVPLGTWLLLVMALAMALCGRRPAATWRDELVLLAPGAVVLALVSSQTGFTRYLRYALPLAPFCFVWISQVARPTVLRRRMWGACGCAALAWSISSSLSVFPHSQSYFNECAGGPRGGPAHLLDGNIDWGQDLLFLKRWKAAHPAAQPFALEYFGFVAPHTAGVEFKKVPRLQQDPETGAVSLSPTLEPGWYAISLNPLYGYKHFGGEEDWYAYLREFSPVARAGYSISIYHLTPDDVRRARDPVRLRNLFPPPATKPVEAGRNAP
jgi:hypothetical protein